MASYNKIVLLGNLTRDPEVRFSTAGTAICKFGIATNEKYGDTERVCFLDVTVFGKQGESCGQYLAKGRQALIEGRLQQENWEGKDGQKRSKHVVIAERVVFVGPRAEGNGGSPATAERMAAPVVDEHDDIPF